MKRGQNVCLYEVSDGFENESCGSKTSSPGHILEKPCLRSKGHIFSQILMKLGQNVCLDEILKMGHVKSQSMSLGQIIEEPPRVDLNPYSLNAHSSVGSVADLRTGGHWFDPQPDLYSF